MVLFNFKKRREENLSFNPQKRLQKVLKDLNNPDKIFTDEEKWEICLMLERFGIDPHKYGQRILPDDYDTPIDLGLPSKKP